MTGENGYRIWWDEENDIARGCVLGVLTLESAKRIHREQDEYIEKYGEGRNWLINLTWMRKANADARKKVAEIASDPKVGKFAFFGASVFVRTVVNFMMAAAHKNNIKHFRTKEEALEWLKAGDTE